MIKRFIENFKKTELYTNRNLQMGILLAAMIITLVSKLLPGIRENILAIMVCLIVVGIPITILGIYDGIVD